MTVSRRVRWGGLISAAGVFAALSVHVETVARQANDDLAATLSLAGARVEQFFARAQRIMCLEIVGIQPLTRGLSSAGLPRTVESELRFSWEPGLGLTEAQTWRQVLKVNGRLPRTNDRDTCTTPEQHATETHPLSMLLPAEREKYAFTLAGATRIDGRAAAMIDYRELGPVSADVRAEEGVEDCISWELHGGQGGRLWIDRETNDVLRLDQRLDAMMDLRVPPALASRPGLPTYITLERQDTTIRFGRVQFHDPDESLVLPLSSISLHVTRGGGAPGLRTTTTYTNYKRFLTGGRLIGSAP